MMTYAAGLDPKIDRLPGLTLEHFCVKFVILDASVYEISCGKNRQAAV